MLTRFNKLITLILVVALTIYVILLNQERITVYLIPGSAIEGHAGVVVIAAFALGMLVMSLIALWVGFRSYLRERALISKDRERQNFYLSMLKARGYLSAGDLTKAKDAWEQAVKRDPTDIIARIELSRSIESLANNDREELVRALKVLDAARATDPKNSEVLYRAAELNVALNNKTAALDNLALIAFHEPSMRALERARDLSEDLDRIGDAIEYQRKLEEIDTSGKDFKAVNLRLRLKQLILENAKDNSQLRDSLKAFIKKNPDFEPALEKLAEIEQSTGHFDEAAQLLSRAGKLSGNTSLWHQAARLWIKNGMPEKAIAAARSAATEAKGIHRIVSEIELLRIYIALSMLEDARRLCDGMPFLLKREAVTLSSSLNHSFLALKGLCLCRMGEYRLTAETLRKLCDDDPEMHELLADRDNSNSSEAPAPRLSTP